MAMEELPSFDAPSIASQLNCMSDGELDALPFGVVEMNHQFKVLGSTRRNRANRSYRQIE
jgi:hypothetical protein